MLCKFVFCSFYTISQKIMYETIYFCCLQSLILHPPFLVHTLSRISSTWPLGLVSVRSLVTLLNVDTQLSAPDLSSVFPVNSQMALLISSSLNVSAHSTKRCKDKTNFFNADPYRVSKTTYSIRSQPKISSEVLNLLRDITYGTEIQ